MSNTTGNATTTATAPGLEVRPSINDKLAPGSTELLASFYVQPHGLTKGQLGVQRTVKAVLFDRSPSMSNPVNKRNLREGKRFEVAIDSSCDFVDSLDEKTDSLVVIAFDQNAKYVYPTDGVPVAATLENKEKAKKAIKRETMGSGTNFAGALRKLVESVQFSGLSLAYGGVFSDGEFFDEPLVKDELETVKALAQGGVNIILFPYCIADEADIHQLVLLQEETNSPQVPQCLMSRAEVRAAFASLASAGADNLLSNVVLCIRTLEQCPMTVKHVSIQNNDITDRMKRRVDDENVIEVPLGPWDDGERLIYVVGDDLKQPSSSNTLIVCQIWFEGEIVGRESIKSKPSKIGVTWVAQASLSSLVSSPAAGVVEAQGREGSKLRIRAAVAKAAAGNVDEANKELGSLYALLLTQPGTEEQREAMHEFIEVIDGPKGVVRIKNADAATLKNIHATASQLRTRRRPGAGAASATTGEAAS